MSSRQIAALFATGIFTAVTGCGGSAGSRTTLTRAELIAKADAICGRVNQRRELVTIKKPQDFLTLLPAFATYERAAYAEFDKLTPPAALAGGWRELVLQAQTIARDTSTVGVYAKAGRIGAARALLEALNPSQKRMDAIARRDGMGECAEVD